MQMTGGGGMFGMGNFPEMYQLVVNANSPLAERILKEEDTEKRNEQIQQALKLAKLSQNLLKGKELTDFVNKQFAKL